MDADDPRLKELVERVELFHGLTTNDVYQIFVRGMTEICVKGETVFFQDTVGNSMYVVLGGKVGVFDGQRQLNTLGVGDTFGEMSLLTHEKRSATVIALEDSKLFVLDEKVFQKLLTKRVAVQMLMNISSLIAKRLVQANKQLKQYKSQQ